MPMFTTSVISLPVYPRHSPERICSTQTMNSHEHTRTMPHLVREGLHVSEDGIHILHHVLAIDLSSHESSSSQIII